MAWKTPAHEWPHLWRYATAATSGIAWTFLWFGFDALRTHPALFAAVALVLVGPTLGFLARNWGDAGGLLATAFGASLAASVFLLTPSPREIPFYVLGVLREWSLVLLAGAGVYALRRRFLKP